MSEMDRFVAEGVRAARRVAVGVVGVTVIVVGVALLVLPGPAFAVLPIGLGILAIEFEWARRFETAFNRPHREWLVFPPRFGVTRFAVGFSVSDRPHRRRRARPF